MRQAKALGARLLRLDQLAIARIIRRRRRHPPFLIRFFINRQDAAAFRRLAEDPDNAVLRLPDLADHAGLVALRRLGQAAQNPVATAQRGIPLARDDRDARRGCLQGPFRRLCKQIAILVWIQDPQHRHRWQLARIGVIRLAPFQRPFRLHLFEDAFQFDPCGAFDAERLRDIAFGARTGVVGNPVEDLLLGGDLGNAHTPALTRRAGGVMRRNAPPDVLLKTVAGPPQAK